MIEDNFRNKGLKKYTYTKNSMEMYLFLQKYGDQKAAIRNAKRLERAYPYSHDYANHNPCTKVYKLVEELEDLKVKTK